MKTYTINPMRTYTTVTVRTFHANGKLSVGEKQLFNTLAEALRFVEREENVPVYAKF